MHVYKHLHDGGTERYIHTLVSRMNEEIYSFSICCLNERGSRAEYFEREKCAVHVLGIRRDRSLRSIANNLVQTVRLRRLLKTERIHVVHTHDNYSAGYARVAALLARVPVVYVTYHSDYQWLSPIHHHINRLMAMITTRIFAVSLTAKTSSRSRDRIPDSKYRVIHNGVTYEEPAGPQRREQQWREWALPEHARLIGSVGMLSKLKGHDVLVRSFGQVAAEFPDTYLVIVGSERDLEPEVKGELQAAAAALKVSERVIFAGSRDDVLQILHCFELFVMPSRVEGFGLALVEAMCSGVPAVVSDIPAFREVTAQGTYALLFESGCSEDLSEKLRYALVHESEMAQRAIMARDYAREIFTADRMVKEYEDAYAGDLNTAGLM